MPCGHGWLKTRWMYPCSPPITASVTIPDFLYCYFGRKYGFVLDHDSATTVTAGIDGGQPWRRTHGDNITYSDWRRDNFYTAVKSLLKPGVKRIGIEFDHVSLDFRALLGNAFPGVEFVDIAQPSMWMRSIKSAEEHALIREGTRICNVGAQGLHGCGHSWRSRIRSRPLHQPMR